MQGQRSATGSLPDPINFDFGSTSSSIGVDQQICWNNLRDPAESRLSDYRIPPGGADAYMGILSQEARNLSRWSIGEPSSSNPQSLNIHDEQMTQNGWWSSMPTSGGAGPRQDSQLYEPSLVASRNSVNLNLNINQIPSEPSFVRSSTHGATSRSDDINVGQLDQVGGDPMDCSNSLKPGELEHRLFPSSSGSEPFASSSGSSRFLVEEDDGRSGCALDGRRLSCKRKTIEGNVGQSSNSGSYFSREGSMWQAIPPCYTAGSSSLNISPQLETSAGVNNPDPVNSRLELSMLGLTPVSLHASNAASGAESSQRNYRLRMNPSNHQDSLSYNSFLPHSTAGHSDVQSGDQPPRLVPVNPHPELVPPVHPENPASQGQPVVFNLPSMRRNVQSVRLGGASRSRAGSLPNSVVSGERDTSMNEDLNSRPMPRNISEHPMFMPSAEVRSNLAQYPPNWSSNGVGLGMPRHIGSSSRTGAASSSHSTLGPSWGSSRRHPSSQYSRRLSEYVRRSLLSSAGSEISGHTGSSSVHRSVPSSSQEVVLPSSGGSHGLNQPFSRSAPWVDRHGDGVIGIPYSLRTLPAAGEGRTRLVSEIRNVLGMMRRGEGLRFEDVMVLDPSVLFEMADIHDQHRDMRLDVDNMSYEELLALEDRIGSVCTGLTEETVTARMKQRKYFAVARSDQTEVEPCCICQEQYNNGEDLGTLDCGHDFHTECIKQWLGQKNLCPICKTTGLAT